MLYISILFWIHQEGGERAGERERGRGGEGDSDTMKGYKLLDSEVEIFKKETGIH